MNAQRVEGEPKLVLDALKGARVSRREESESRRSDQSFHTGIVLHSSGIDVHSRLAQSASISGSQSFSLSIRGEPIANSCWPILSRLRGAARKLQTEGDEPIEA